VGWANTVFDPGLAQKQGKQLAKLVRWFASAEVLKMATADNGERLAKSGLRNSYPGELGVEEGDALDSTTPYSACPDARFAATHPE